MSDLLILGTDTDAGKTTFAALWLSAFTDYEYWKPLETGPSDSQIVQSLAPSAMVHAPFRKFVRPVAPPLAARDEHTDVPSASEIAAGVPARHASDCHFLIETFGSPFSPLNDTELQITLIQRLGRPTILVSNSSLGTIGRTIQCVEALQSYDVEPLIVLLGPTDEYAQATIAEHVCRPVFSLSPPSQWDAEGIAGAALQQRGVLEQIRSVLSHESSAETTPEGRKSHNLLADDQRWVWHPYTSLGDRDPPLPCVKAHDEFLHLADGRKIIDGISSWWTILHGHGYPPLKTALRNALAKIDHVQFAGVTHPYGVELAGLMLETMPWKSGRVFYSDNGSTAVEVALKMAYQYWCHHGEPQRKRYIGFENAYHGDTFGAMAVSRDPVFFGRFEPLLCQADIVPISPDALAEHLRKHTHEVAAVIIEPLVQGAGGMRMHTPETLRQLWQVVQDHGVLFIADEVMTGGGRTGTLWAFQSADIVPDLVCASKTIAGGMMPLAATLVSPRVVSAFETEDRTRTFFHGHSFTGHPLACAAGVANWKLLQDHDFEVVRRIERHWQETLLPLRENPNVRDVRIRGIIGAIELAVEGGYLADVGRRLRAHCLEHDVFLRPLGSVLYTMPPYCASEASLAKIDEAMKAAVYRIQRDS